MDTWQSVDMNMGLNQTRSIIYTTYTHPNLFTFACVCVWDIDMLPYKNTRVQPFCSGEAHGLGLNFDQACVAKGFIKHKDLH
jgi:hypothetical protein